MELLKSLWKQRRTLILICIVGTIISIPLAGLSPKPDYWTKAIAKNLGDSISPVREDPHPLFLGIDQDTINLENVSPEEIAASPALQIMQKGFPWKRDIYAMIMDRLISAGARVVVFDIMFPTPSASDEVFREALERNKDHVVIGYNFPMKDEDRMSGSVVFPTTDLIPHPDANDARLGFVTVRPDADEVVRRVWFRVSLLDLMKIAPLTAEGAKLSGAGSATYESLAARALRQFGEAKLIPPGTDSRVIRYSYYGVGAGSRFAPHSLYEIFVDAFWKNNYKDGAVFKDKIVVVGPIGDWSKDQFMTPSGLVPGPVFHINAINALLTSQFLYDASHLDKWLILVGGFLALLLGWVISHPIYRAIALSGTILLWFAVAVAAYLAGYIIPIFHPLLALTLSGGLYVLTEYVHEQRERRRIRSTLERYVSRDVVKEVLDNPESYLHLLVGKRRNITILFSDVRGFTSITESSSDPAALVTQLNEYFTAMVRIVFRNGGTLDKFIGDAVMAHWGGTVSHGEAVDASGAVATAVEMIIALNELNEGWKAAGKITLSIGLGLNHGDAIVGNLGSEEKQEFTAIGDAVNLASRLESATKEFHVDILIGAEVARLVEGSFILRSVHLFQPPGKSIPTEVFTVLGKVTDPTPEWLAAYEEGIVKYRVADFSAAAAAFEKARGGAPTDWLIGDYLRRSRELEQHPPEPGWSPAYIKLHK